MKPNHNNFFCRTSLLQNPTNSLPPSQNFSENDPPSTETMAAGRDPRCSTNRDLTPSKLNPGRAGIQPNIARLPSSIPPSSETAESVRRPSIPSDSALASAAPSSITDLGRSTHQEKGAQKEGALIFCHSPQQPSQQPLCPI